MESSIFRFDEAVCGLRFLGNGLDSLFVESESFGSESDDGGWGFDFGGGGLDF